MTKKQEVAKATSTEVSTYLNEDWGAGEDIQMKPTMIPKIRQVQKMSKMVDEYSAQEGEFRDSISGELLGTKDVGPEVVIFAQNETWVLSEVTIVNAKKVKKYMGTEPITAENANEPWFDEATGVERRHTFNFFCLRALGEKTVEEVPYLLSMDGYSKKAAERLQGLFVKMKRMKKPSAAVVLRLKSKREKNDDGTWVSIDWEVVRDTTTDELKVAHEWWKLVRAGKAKAVEDEVEETKATPAPKANGAVKTSYVSDDQEIPF